MTASLLLLISSLAAAPSPRLGAEIVIDVPTQGPVIAVLGTILVESEVAGDVISLAGDVTLAPSAVVRGDVVAVGGQIHGTGNVEGRAVSTATLGFVSGDERRVIDGAQLWGIRMLRLGGWLLLAGLMITLLPRAVRTCGGELQRGWLRALVIGALSLAVWLLLVVMGLALAASPVGVAILLLLVAVFLGAKVVGVTAVAWWLAGGLVPVLPRRLRQEAVRTGLVVVCVLLLAAVPIVGAALWLFANVAGIGAFVVCRLRRSSLLVALPQAMAR